MFSGAFACVYSVSVGSERFAIRCFTREVKDQQRRYNALSDYLTNVVSPSFVGFEYLQHGIAVKGTSYPVVKMEWVEGELLSDYVRSHLGDPTALDRIAAQWRGTTVSNLRGLRIAHNDLQHGNVMVQRDGNIRLVDYDGMFLPQFRGEGSPELGHKNYQHPDRSSKDYDNYVDNFPSLVIYLSLRAVSSEPDLWGFHNDDNLIFTNGDYAAPENSELFDRLKSSHAPDVVELTKYLEACCALPVEKVPDLETVLHDVQTGTPPSDTAPPATITPRPEASVTIGQGYRRLLQEQQSSPRRVISRRRRSRTPSASTGPRRRVRWRLLIPGAGATVILVAVTVLAIGVQMGWWVLPWESRPAAIAVDLGAASSISSGIEHSCRIRTDLSVVCWGDNQYGQSSPPQGSFTLVSTGQSHSCGVGADGSVECWGNHAYGQSSPSGGAYRSVSAGLTHSCGVKIDGSVECWGGNDVGKATPPGGFFSAVSAGWYHSCGVASRGMLTCWGDDAHGQSSPPGGTFTSVSVGQRHSCGVNTNNELVCWGSNDNGQASPPGGAFVSVSAGSLHNCGVSVSGPVECWGNDHYGQASPPDGAFASVSSGLFHSCGVRTDGSVECWGSNERGQSAPPVPQ